MMIICVSVVVIYTAKGLAAYGQEVILSRIGNKIVADTQVRLFDSVLRQDLAFFHSMGTAELITRLTHNARAASSALNMIATSLGRDLLTVVSLVGVMIVQDPLLTAIALIGVPLLFLAVSKLLKQVRKLFRREVDTVSRLVAIMQETAHGIRIVRAFRLEVRVRADGAAVGVRAARGLEEEVVAEARVAADDVLQPLHLAEDPGADLGAREEVP